MSDLFAGPTMDECSPLSEARALEVRRTDDHRIGHPSPGAKVIRVVLVEDDDDYVLLVTKMLREGFGHHLELTCVDHLSAARQTVREKDVDCLLIDLGLPDARRLEALRALQEAVPDVPIVVLSGHEDETLAIEAVQAGAQDYLVKGYLDTHRLGRAIRYAIVRKRRKLELARQAVEDPLTGLPNRRLFDEHLRVALERSRRRDSSVAVLFLDLDRFKTINDGFGHHTGDRLLVEVAKRLGGIARPYDTLARFGGDEFLLLLDDVTDDRVVFAVANRLIESASEPFLIDGDEVFVGLSIGIAFSHSWQTRSETLVRNADQALYLAKEQASGYEVFGSETHSQGPTAPCRRSSGEAETSPRRPDMAA